MKKKKLDEYEKLDILSSIWILSCNDENPQVTYQGVKYRLGLPDDFDLKTLIHSKGELFRKRTTLKQLNSWKDDMLNNRHLPSWIRDITDKGQREKLINDLTIDDVFRNQFRAEANSPRANIEIINWGLQHIDKLRTSKLERRKTRISIFSSVWVPIFTTIVAIVTVISSFFVQYTSNKNQTLLKQYEIEIRPKQVGYSDFMKLLTPTYYSAMYRNNYIMTQNIDKIEGSYYSFEPFLRSKDRSNIWEHVQEFSRFCTGICKSDSLNNIDKSVDSFLLYRNYFRDYLYTALFHSGETIIQKQSDSDSKQH